MNHVSPQRRTFQLLALLLLLLLLPPQAPLHAQVTTATLIGVVQDSSGAAIPGASVLATHEGTGVARHAVTDDRGEFVLSALPNGSFLVNIELTGFKTVNRKGLILGSGQSIRETFTLDVGAMEETVTVAGETPLLQASSSNQADMLGTQEVRELPVSRRNLGNLIGLAPGVSTSGSGNVQMNGVAAGGTGLTVDGTEANSNPEARSLSQYGGQNQISVMSLDSIQEVQIVKGVLPAEYGGVAGGQVNVISRSGTNRFQGTAFYNLQDDLFNARQFLSTTAKPDVKFNQYGGTLGGPVLPNKLFFFATYEGYRETAGIEVTGTVPLQATKDALLAALPYPETRLALDTLPQPTEPVVSSSGVVSTQIGRYRGIGTRRRTENHYVVKGDLALFNGATLATTYTRMRPWTLEPRFNVDGSNDRVFPNEQDRVASQLVVARGPWVYETRFGYNRTYLARLDEFFKVLDPKNQTEIGNYGRRVGLINISGLFSTPSSEIYDLTGGAWSFDQKVTRTAGKHLIKSGFRWVRQTGNKMSPQNPQFQFQTLADALANIPQSIIVSFGAPRYKSHIDEFGGFIQDDWRITSNLTLNLGLRYDYYATIRIEPTSEVPVEIVNLAPFTDVNRLDFGPPLDPSKPYNPDAMNFGPRVGFAWTLGESARTVVRGGVGYLFSPHLPATVRQSVADPYVGFRVSYNRTEVAARNLKWPGYSDDYRAVVQNDSAGRKTVFSVFDPDISAPYTIQSMISVQRSIGSTMAVEAGYVRTNGRDLPLQRLFQQAFDRQTGVRPNPSLGAPGGYYVDSGQTMLYDGLQVSFDKRMSRGYAFTLNYTLGKGEATQGGDLAAYYAANIGNTQDFFDPEFDRGPTDNDVRHRLASTIIYEVPNLGGSRRVLNAILHDWQISGIITAQTGNALLVTQPSGIPNSRPDIVSGAPLVVDNWRETCAARGCSYLDPAAFALVPTSSVTQATLRPGTYGVGAARGPGAWNVNATLARNITLTGQTRLQIRVDVFNLFNIKNWNAPNTAINSPEFGRITGAAPARTAQVGARLSF